MKYRLSIQVLRGFGSLSMYRKALSRAVKRGVKRIVYVGDFGPSGLLIDKIAEKEMSIRVERIALSEEQVKKYRIASTAVNLRDPRAADYIRRYGMETWEVEAMPPKALLRLIERRLWEIVPAEYLRQAEARERAARMVSPITKMLRRAVEREGLRLLKKGWSREAVLSHLRSRYGLLERRRRARKRVAEPRAR